MSWLIQSSNLEGTISAPASKSLTLRAIIVASLADGVSVIENYLESDDTDAAIECLRLAGIEITKNVNELTVVGNTFTNSKKIFNARSSATVLRFLIPIFLVKFNDFKITGNEDLLKRPLDAFYELFIICKHYNSIL